MITINTPQDYLAFASKYADSPAIRSLSRDAILLILNMQSFNAADMRQDSYDVLDRLFARNDYPLTDDTLILYRGGRTSPNDLRDYISATAFLDIAHNYANPRHTSTIFVEKGSKILPFRAVHEYAGDGEGEILICTHNLRRTFHLRRFVYR